MLTHHHLLHRGCALRPLGSAGMFFVMAIAGIVCTALLVSGQAITDFKTGLLAGFDAGRAGEGEIPRRIAASAAVGLNHRRPWRRLFQFRRGRGGRYPRGTAVAAGVIMKALVEGFMSRQPWPTSCSARERTAPSVMEMLACRALLFAPGMYLPLDAEYAGLSRGAVWHISSVRALGEAGRRRRGANGIRGARRDIASGLLSGGAWVRVSERRARLIPSFQRGWDRRPFYGMR